VLDRTINTSGSISQTNWYLQIGGSWGSSWRAFDGTIDEPKVFNRALSDAEVNTIYESEKP